MREDQADRLKRTAGEVAAGLVKPGMVVGLGTGSTAIWSVRRLGQLLAAGELHDITAVATSRATAAEAARLQIPLLDDSVCASIDLTIDGADEIDPHLRLIKGGGGALLREKLVAQMSRRFIIVADNRKLVQVLGAAFPLPVEVVPFAWKSQAAFIEDSIGADPTLRLQDGSPYVTDNGNYILDCSFPYGLTQPEATAAALDARTGIVDHGLFLGMATQAVVAGPEEVRWLP